MLQASHVKLLRPITWTPRVAWARRAGVVGSSRATELKPIFFLRLSLFTGGAFLRPTKHQVPRWGEDSRVRPYVLATFVLGHRASAALCPKLCPQKWPLCVLEPREPTTP